MFIMDISRFFMLVKSAATMPNADLIPKATSTKTVSFVKSFLIYQMRDRITHRGNFY